MSGRSARDPRVIRDVTTDPTGRISPAGPLEVRSHPCETGTKVLSGLNQNGMWSGTGAHRSPVVDVAPPAERHDLTPGSIEEVNEVTPLSSREGRPSAKEADEAAGKG